MTGRPTEARWGRSEEVPRRVARGRSMFRKPLVGTAPAQYGIPLVRKSESLVFDPTRKMCSDNTQRNVRRFSFSAGSDDTCSQPTSSLPTSSFISSHLRRDGRWKHLYPIPLCCASFVFAAILLSVSISHLLHIASSHNKDERVDSIWSEMLIGSSLITVVHSPVDLICYFLDSLKPTYVLALSCALMVVWIFVVGFGAYWMYHITDMGCATRDCDYSQAQFSFSVFILILYMVAVMISSRAQEQVLKDVARDRRELYRSMHEVRTTQRMQQSHHQQLIEQLQPTALAHGAVNGAAERFADSSQPPQYPQHHFRFGVGYEPVIPRSASGPAHGRMDCRPEASTMRGSNATATVGS